MAGALLGLAQLLLLFAFVCAVVYLNVNRPINTHYRPFLVKWWAPALLAAMLLIGLAMLLDFPHHLQATNRIVADRHAAGRAICQRLIEEGADHSHRVALFEQEYYRDNKSISDDKMAHKSGGRATVASLLSPLLNMLLFNTGATICSVPLLVYLAIRMVLQKGADNSLELLRRESGVLLPVLNLISVVSAFTAPTFYLFIQPNRVDRCIYTSGHWFTFAVTLLLFTVIIAHLASYQKYCHSSNRLLALYVGWLALYIMFALSVLKTTQEAFHDSVEACDGLRQSLPAFIVYMILFLALQLITFITTDSANTTGDSAAVDVQQQSASNAATIPSAAAKQPSPDETAKSPSRAEQSQAQQPIAAPLAPPLSPTDIPTAPPPPSSSARPSSSNAGLTQRRSTAPAPPVPDTRSSLLSAITSGVKLRSVTAAKSAQRAEATGLEKMLSNIRMAVQPDGESDMMDWE